jgi:hypothetical protein
VRRLVPEYEAPRRNSSTPPPSVRLFFFLLFPPQAANATNATISEPKQLLQLSVNGFTFCCDIIYLWMDLLIFLL